MVQNSKNLQLDTVVASMQEVGGLGNIQVRAADTIEHLGLSRLRLLAVLIDLEDKFAIEFPDDAIDGFRNIDDIRLYIHSHAMTPDGDAADEQPVATCHSIDRRVSIRDRVRRVCAQARLWCMIPPVAPRSGTA
jgi:acyl carrier protein